LAVEILVYQSLDTRDDVFAAAHALLQFVHSVCLDRTKESERKSVPKLQGLTGRGVANKGALDIDRVTTVIAERVSLKVVCICTGTVGTESGSLWGDVVKLHLHACHGGVEDEPHPL
jgi:hypothetical protein